MRRPRLGGPRHRRSVLGRGPLRRSPARGAPVPTEPLPILPAGFRRISAEAERLRRTEGAFPPGRGLDGTRAGRSGAIESQLDLVSRFANHCVK